MRKTFLLLAFISLSNLLAQFGSQDSGGKLMPEQAAYDVKFYDLNLTIDPEDKAIGGNVTVTAEIVNPIDKFVLNLDTVYVIDRITLLDKTKEADLNYNFVDGKIWIALPHIYKPGEIVSTKIYYAGLPRVPKNPPWDDGLIWKQSKDGSPWVTVTCQGGGADLWWPCKDHPSDEADSVATHFTVPADLYCVSNGKLRGITDNGDNTKTFYWFSSNPVNNYNVTFYLGPYKEIDYKYTSIAGDKFPFIIYYLPESFEKAKEHSPQFLQHMKVMEELCGPYPFRADKYSVVEAPHLGMEHQTCIAYGYGWKDDPKFPFDWLHQHEFSHEWWGNMLTAKDWSDFWIHEGIGTYMQPLYLEKMFGKKMYHDYMASIKRFSNKAPVAPRKSETAGEAYNLDVYYKGAWILHTLRHYLGDDIMFKLIRRWAYPDPAMEKVTDGRQCRFATTDDMLEVANKVTGKNLDWFFEVYFRHAPLPILNVKEESGKLLLSWNTENNLPFNLPVDVQIADKVAKVEMNDNKGEIALSEGSNYKIDPEQWVLMDKINYEK